MDLVSQNKAGNKVKVTLSISEEARLKAKKMGLNMSSILENTLLNGLFSSGSSRFSINANEYGQITPKTELISTNNLVLGDTFCARSSFTPSEIEEGEYAILPYSLVKNLISEGFFTDSSFTESKRELLISLFKHSHLIQMSKKDNKLMLDLKNIIENVNYDPYSVHRWVIDSREQNDEKTVKKLPLVSYGTYEGNAVKELFKLHKEPFLEWAKKSIKLESTLNDYVTILENMSIRCPMDIVNYASDNKCEFTDWKERALTKFLRYWERISNDDEPELNGHKLSVYYQKMRIVRKERNHTENKSHKQKAISKVITDAKELTNADIIEELNLLPDGLKNFYKIMVYSGIRASHLYRLLESKNKIIEDKGEFIKVSADNVQLGNKKLFIGMYVPTECKNYIKNFRPAAFRSEKNKKYTYDNVCARMKNNLSSGRRITSKSLRKFNLNFMRQNGVSGVIADYIQSRTDGSIRMLHYENTNPLADAEYAKLASKFLELLPF